MEVFVAVDGLFEVKHVETAHPQGSHVTVAQLFAIIIRERIGQVDLVEACDPIVIVFL